MMEIDFYKVNVNKYKCLCWMSFPNVALIHYLQIIVFYWKFLCFLIVLLYWSEQCSCSYLSGTVLLLSICTSTCPQLLFTLFRQGLFSLDVAVDFGQLQLIAPDWQESSRCVCVVYMGIEAACACVVATEMVKFVSLYFPLCEKVTSFHSSTSKGVCVVFHEVPSVYNSPLDLHHKCTQKQLFSQVNAWL